MTYCLALRLKEGLVFATDSRTTAGVDHINTYRKMHVFQPGAERFFVVLTSGNLATTQEVLDNLHRDLDSPDAKESFRSANYLFEAARYLGRVLCQVERSHEAALKGSGASGNATLILGGQIAGQPPGLYLVYPEGNYVAATEETPFLQLGEFKYGKPILSRIANATLSLDDAARLALISFDAAMKSNLSVGPPLEVAIYPTDSLAFSHHLRLGADSEFFRDFSRRWNAKMQAAFRQLPRFEWERHHGQ
ncbi:MAG: peptidase [Steroidobacteraceae bacterium]